MGKRIRRTSVGPEDLSIEAKMLLATLPIDGSTVGNYSVRSQLDMDGETYARAKRELRDKELIKVGAGYGGTVSRVSAVRAAEADEELPQAVLVKFERELYEPFKDWLQSSLADQDLKFAEARITGTPNGHKRRSGQWSRPDVTAVQVQRYVWLPEINVEVSTYEIKPAPEATKLESVYEAAAHGRRAHRASLVIELADRDEPAESILSEVRRFNLGLYTMRRQFEGHFKIDEIIQPPSTEAQPQNLNELLEHFLGKDRELRERYSMAIGK